MQETGLPKKTLIFCEFGLEIVKIFVLLLSKGRIGEV
jgi:hypothetical protein